MKTLREWVEESTEIVNKVDEGVREDTNVTTNEDEDDDEGLEEGAGGHDVELKPHSNGTHYIVHKIGEKSGIEPDQLKVGEKISDTHVDDLHDMGYRVKIHKGTNLKEAQTLGSALRNSLARPEPGSKLDRSIKAHNRIVKAGGKGTLEQAPEGHYFDKRGYCRLGDG